MKQPLTIILTCAAIASLAMPAALASETTPPAPERRPHGPGPSAEMQAYHAWVMSIYDADKNGVLDETERSVLHDDIIAGKMEPPPHPRGRGRMGPPPGILARYDTDNDGTLNAAERAALEADIASGKIPPPPRHGPPPAEETAPAATATKS